MPNKCNDQASRIQLRVDSWWSALSNWKTLLANLLSIASMVLALLAIDADDSDDMQRKLLYSELGLFFLAICFQYWDAIESSLTIRNLHDSHRIAHPGFYRVPEKGPRFYYTGLTNHIRVPSIVNSLVGFGSIAAIIALNENDYDKAAEWIAVISPAFFALVASYTQSRLELEVEHMGELTGGGGAPSCLGVIVALFCPLRCARGQEEEEELAPAG